jgi:TatD DNase family protein
MVDAHCHLNDEKYPEEEIPEIVSRARKAGVKEMICAGASLKSSKRAIEISHKYEGVWATVGIHPEDLHDWEVLGTDKTIDLLSEWASDPNVVAIGETGLDYREETNEEEKTKQKNLFKVHLEVSRKTGLPIVIHNRGGDAEMWELLKDHTTSGQLHCFVSTKEFMEEAASRGWYISFGGIITFKRNEHLLDIVKATPEDRLLVETDAPYLAPEPVRGSRNEPANVKMTVEAAAQARGTSINQIEAITTRNAHRLFGKMI